MKKLSYVLATTALSAGVAFSVVKFTTPQYSSSLQASQNAPVYTTSMNNGGASGVDFTQAAEQSVNAVVHIQTKAKRQNIGNDPFESFFFGNPYQRSQPQIEESSGSGVIISSDGYIATNNHVVEGSDEIEVVLNNRKSYTATVVGTDPSTDLALLKIKDTELPYLLYGNSDEVRLGEWVLAVGNPFNLTSTVTAGIVSAKGRNINIIGSNQNKKIFPIESFIQTDAAVNPGNSGGALVDTKGKLIGINTAIASTTGSFAGYSFAVPVNIVKKVMDDLLAYGEVQRALLGVGMRDVDAKLAQERSLKNTAGVYVSGIAESSAADDAGFKEGDVIVKLDAAKINTAAELQEQIGRHRPGDKVNITVVRNDAEKELAVILKNRNGNTNVVKNAPSETSVLLGATLEEVNAEDKQFLRIAAGVRIKKLDNGKLRNAGIKEGFVITSIDKKQMLTVNEVTTALNNKKGGVLIEGVYANGMRAYYGFGL
jgi:serine protease Do